MAVFHHAHTTLLIAAVKKSLPLIQTLHRAGTTGTLFVNSCRFEIPDQNLENIFPLLFHACRGNGTNHRIVINIRDQAGKTIAFSVDQPICTGVFTDDSFTQLTGG